MPNKLKNNPRLNITFLLIGIIFMIFGYQKLDPTRAGGPWVHDDLVTGFFLTVFGATVFGKWLSDYYTKRK